MKSVLSITLLASLFLTSCVSLRVGPDEEFLRMKGLVNVYGTAGGLNDWDGTLFDLGLFTNTGGRSEILSVEVGPLAAVGVGLVGARARVLPFEFGVGTLFYNPRPASPIEVHELPPDEEADEPDEGEGELGEPAAREASVEKRASY